MRMTENAATERGAVAQAASDASRPGISYISYLVARVCLWVLTRTIYRVHARGLENLPASGGALLVCNHVSFIDPFIVGAPMWRYIRFIMLRRFSGGIYAFEHPTMCAGPIDNAIALLESLPVGAHLSLVSHSRGGLVGDLLCLGEFGSMIEPFHRVLPGVGVDDPQRTKAIVRELDGAHAEQRASLRKLAKLLAGRL